MIAWVKITISALITVIVQMISRILPNQIYIRREQSFKGSASLSKRSIDVSYKAINENSADYIKKCYSILRNWCNETLEVNVESERLKRIVDSNEPCIFIMNHTTNPMKDIKAAKFFNTLLYREYIYGGKAETCPRSKVLANKNILRAQSDNGEMFKWMGVTPISAHITKSNKEENNSVISEMVQKLASGKINLFLFPEGALCAFPFLPMKYKFQPGVSSIVKKVLEYRDSIKVVPIGFAHKSKLSSAHIGEPVCFIKDKEGGAYKALKGSDTISLTENGEPVSKEGVVPYISGVLLKCLKDAKQNAKNDLKNAKEQVYTL